MARQKEKSEVEYLRAENRKLKSQLRETKRSLVRFEKRSHLHDETPAEEDVPEALEELVINTCPKCTGNLEYTDLGIRTLIRCENCTYRQTRKK